MGNVVDEDSGVERILRIAAHYGPLVLNVHLGVLAANHWFSQSTTPVRKKNKPYITLNTHISNKKLSEMTMQRKIVFLVILIHVLQICKSLSDDLQSHEHCEETLFTQHNLVSKQELRQAIVHGGSGTYAKHPGYTKCWNCILNHSSY